MPAEWERQDYIWITWPYNKSDWPGLFKYIPPKIAEIIAHISKNQRVNLIIKVRENVFNLKKFLKSFSANIKNIKFSPSNRLGTSNEVTGTKVLIELDGPGMIIILPKKCFMDVILKFNQKFIT